MLTTATLMASLLSIYSPSIQYLQCIGTIHSYPLTLSKVGEMVVSIGDTFP